MKGGNTDPIGKQVESDAIYKLATVSITIRGGQLYDSSGEPIALRAKSSRVLKILLEHRGSVVSKDALAKAVWPKTLATDESISKCISEIRKVLGLCAAFAIRFENNWTVLSRADEERALFYANEAVRLDPELWMGHYALGRLNAAVANQDLEAATTHLEKAMSLQPTNDDIRVFLAVTRILKGQQTEAIPLLEAALASHPTPPFWYFMSYGHALIQSERFEDAVAPLLKCLEQMPTSPYCLRFQIANYALLGHIDDAQWAADEYGALGFDVTIPAIMANTLIQHLENRALIESGLRKAGIVE